jgi:ketosteroid isomerase-like protein
MMIHEWTRNWATRALWCGCAGLPLLVAGCKDAPPPVDTREVDEHLIRDLDAQWSQAAGMNKLDEVVSYYSVDASLLAPNEPMATGETEIRKVWQGLLGPGVSVSWLPTKVEVSRSGDMAYLVGTYRLEIENPGGKTITDHGKILEVWKKTITDGWKAVADTYNSDMPLAVVEVKKK